MQYNTMQYNTKKIILINKNERGSSYYVNVRFDRYTMQYNTIQYNTIQYNTIQCNCGENDTSLALIGQCNQIEHYNTKQYNTI